MAVQYRWERRAAREDARRARVRKVGMSCRLMWRQHAERAAKQQRKEKPHG